VAHSPPSRPPVPERLPSLLHCLAEHGVRAFFTGLGRETLVLGDDETLPDLLALGEDRACRVHLLDDVDAVAGNFVDCLVWVGRGEAEAVAEVRARFPKAVVRGVIEDLLPRLASGRPVDAAASPAESSYVVLCAPRTGSYYLCSLLRGVGLGVPDEHLDQGLCAAARRDHLSLERYLEDLTAVATANGWFGTKLIAHVLRSAFDSGLAPEAFAAWLERHSVRGIRLTRADAVAQAVSNYVARRTGQWTSEGGRSSEPPPYDFEEIRSDWRDVRDQERWLDLVCARLPVPCHRIVYEELDANPEPVMRGVLEFLGALAPDAPMPTLASPLRRQRSERSRAYAARFAAELAAVDPD
jgi:LPS sulfotransferase NodH